MDGSFRPLYQHFLNCNQSDVIIYFGCFLVLKSWGPFALFGNQLAARSRDCIKQNVNFGPKVPNFSYCTNTRIEHVCQRSRGNLLVLTRAFFVNNEIYMAFLLNSQAQGVSGKMNNRPKHHAWCPQRRRAQCSCIGLRPALHMSVLI